MTPVWGAKPQVVAFVAELSGVAPDFGRCQTMAVLDRTGKMVAGVVFHNWNPNAGVIEISAASISKKWATRTVINEAFAYAFNYAGCQMVMARTAMGNSPTRRLWKAFGAEEFILPRLRGRTASEAILLLTDDAWAVSRLNVECRNGKTKTARAARSRTDGRGANRAEHINSDCAAIPEQSEPGDA